jgi:hypothetical protein
MPRDSKWLSLLATTKNIVAKRLPDSLHATSISHSTRNTGSNKLSNKRGESANRPCHRLPTSVATDHYLESQPQTLSDVDFTERMPCTVYPGGNASQQVRRIDTISSWLI